MRRRRPIVFALILITFFGVLAGAHGYFIERLVLEPGFPRAWQWLIVALGANIILHPILYRRFGLPAGRALALPAHLWLASCFYLLIVLAASDVVLFLGGLGGLEVARVRAFAVLAVTAAVLGFGALSAVRLPSVKRVEVGLENLPPALDGYRLVQLSDVHLGALIGRRFAEGVTERVNALAADLVVITGDLVDGSVPHLSDVIAPLSGLHARDGVFFVTGNHDYYSGATAWCAHLEGLGIEVLRNRRVSFSRGAARLELAGIDDYSSRGRCDEDLDTALEGWDGKSPLVLLAHDPRAFEHAHARGALLQLSGHTHGGQIWPFTFLVRLQTRFVAGLYRVGRALLYVSRGTGYWGPPVRVLADAEITEIVLRPAAQAA